MKVLLGSVQLSESECRSVFFLFLFFINILVRKHLAADIEVFAFYYSELKT